MTEREIFMAVLDLPDPEARASYLNGACGGDHALRARVEALLRSHDGAGRFLSRPAVAPLAPTMAATLDLSDERPADRTNPKETIRFLTAPGRPDSVGRIGHYEVLEVLGCGGFGIVLRAFDECVQRVVAIKVLAPEMAVASAARKRFLREARSSAKVRHENVVAVHAVEEQPLPYLVMDFIPGETLEQRLDRTGPLETSEVLEIGRQMAEGLAAAHAQALIHRDIKPAHVLIEGGSQDRVKLTDFGLARAVDDASLSQTGIVAGTPMFMSPEQAKGESLDHRSDLFSLGSVLYTMCTGRPPFRAEGTFALLKRVAEDTPRPIAEISPETPQWLCDIIARLHAKKPEDRFDSARQVADLLAHHVAELHPQSKVWSAASNVADPAPGPSPIRQQLSPNHHWAAVAAMLVLGLAGLGFTEASGVTNLHGTVIRLFSAEATLVIEVEEPGVRIAIDDGDLIITGAGVQEIRLKSGPHTVLAMKDGKVLRQELVSVATHGRQVVRVRREARSGTETTAAGEVSGVEVIGEGPVETLAARLKQLNPEFKGTIRLKEPNDLVIDGSGMRDISPVRTFHGLQRLECTVKELHDLSPLRGMHLGDLSVRSTAVFDLSPLRGMELNQFECTASQIVDLWPLRGMPLRDVQLACTAVVDLTPLKGMKIWRLNCDGCKGLSDLYPLQGMPLTNLILRNTRVSDLSPLRGMQLTFFDYTNTLVSDISALKDMALEDVHCDFHSGRDAVILRSMTSLKTINGQPAAEFWKHLDQVAHGKSHNP